MKSNNLNLLNSDNFDGVECMHYAHGKEDVDKITAVAGRKGLYLTGGSDYVWREDGMGALDDKKYVALDYIGKSIKMERQGCFSEIEMDEKVTNQFGDIRSVL